MSSNRQGNGYPRYRRRIGPILRYAPTSFALLFAVLLFIFSWQPSGGPQIYIFSYFRAAVLGMLAAAVVYLAISLKLRRLLVFNNFAAYSVVAALVLAEVLVRLFPALLPPGFRFVSPQAGDGPHAEAWTPGKPLLYQFPRQAAFPDKPWVTIDSLGYRNSAELGDEVDIVLLGDSVTIALAAEEDLGELLRKDGFSVVNLAMEAYSPFQYRDAYESLIIEPGLAHRQVVITLCGANDFTDAVTFVNVSEHSGDYNSYLGQTLIPGMLEIDARYVPRVLLAAAKTLHTFKDIANGKRGAISGVVQLPYATHRATEDVLTSKGVTSEDLSFKYVCGAIDEILEKTRAQNVPTLIAFHPPSNLLYEPFLVGHEEFRARMKSEHDAFMKLLKARFEEEPLVRVFDLTPALQEAVKRESISVVPLEFHLNTQGVKEVYRALRPQLSIARPET